jgi:hypothetical protein
MVVKLDPIILPLLVSGSLPPDRVSVIFENLFALKRFQGNGAVAGKGRSLRNH